jgi:hypothetical protein
MEESKLPRAKRATEPQSVQVILGANNPAENHEIKTTQETTEKPANWFWDKLAEISAESWKAGEYTVWITRLGDSRVPMAAGEKGYLDMFIEPITPATIKQKYGGGKYQAVLNRRGRAVTSHNFEIEGQAIFDARRERPQNSPAVQATNNGQGGNDSAALIDILREELKHLREQQSEPNAANDKTVEIMSNAANKAAEIMEKQIPQAGNPATMIKDLVSAMKDLGITGGAQQQNNPLKELFAMLTPLVPILSPLLERILKPQDPLSQISQFMAVMDKLDELRGGAGGKGHGTTTNDLILAGINTLPQVIQDMNAAKAAAPRGPRQLPQAPAPPAGAPIRTTSPLSAPLAAPGTQAPGAAPISSSRPLTTVRLDDAPMPRDPAAGAAAAPPPSVVAGEPAKPTEQEYNSWVSTRMVEMLYLGFDGYDIATWLEIVKPQIVRDLDKYDIAQIEALFKMDPVLAHALDHPNWQRVIAEAKEAAADAVADAAEADREAAHETAPQFQN